MLQNKISFNQSSVSLEIIGLPDYSKNEKDDQISIISEWKLFIIDKPLIEGNINHLNLIMDAFYTYSTFLINDEFENYESKLIDIKFENFFTHSVLLKSSKPNVKPLKMKIGNSVLADIINCFDQLKFSKNVKIVEYNRPNYFFKKRNLYLSKKKIISNFLLLPLISLLSLLLISTALVYFYDFTDTEKKSLLIELNKSK